MMRGRLLRHHDAVGAQFIAPSPVIAPSATRRFNAEMKQGAINRAPMVGETVRAFKARCAYAINQFRAAPGTPVWQRNYYEHIIRSEADLYNIREYIVNNPLN